MKSSHTFGFFAAALMIGATAATAQSGMSAGTQVPIPTTAAQVPGPVPGNLMTPAYVQLSDGWPIPGAIPW